MPKFVAVTSPGLNEALCDEIKSLGITHAKLNNRSVEFESNWEGCYRVNLQSRLATRVLLPILEFPAYKLEELYHNIKKHDFTKYIEADGEIWIDAKADMSAIKHQQMLAMKVKDAIVDQFRDKFGERPNVDKKAALVIYLRGFKNNYVVSIDTSSPTLNQRGYRVDQTEAPLKENVAAGLLALVGWNGDKPIIDPMCGSGTILIEAALKAMKRAPGTLRKGFAFQRLKTFQRSAWDKIVNEAIEMEEETSLHFYGYDTDRKAIAIARKNAAEAEVDHLITFERKDVVELEAPCEDGVIVTNPPYGIRSGDEFFLDETYKNMSYNFKSNFKGWDVWLLSGNPDMTRHLRMKAEKKFPILNGGIDCRFIHYKIKP